MKNVPKDSEEAHKYGFLCKRLEPFVGEVFKAQLEKDGGAAFKRGVPVILEFTNKIAGVGKKFQKSLAKEMSSELFSEIEERRAVSAQRTAVRIAHWWSEELCKIFEKEGYVPLCACLLPKNSEQAKRMWCESGIGKTTNYFDLTRKEVKDVLRKLKKSRLEWGIWLPWGGVIKRGSHGPILEGSVLTRSKKEKS